MYDFAFDRRTLGREFIKADFKADPQLLDEAFRSGIVNVARTQASSGFINFSLLQSSLRGKAVYQAEHLEHSLILRKFSRNIRRLTRVKQGDRNSIIKSLKTLLAEGHTYRVYKLDLKTFYESIDRSGIDAQLKRDSGLSPPTLHVFQSFSGQLNALGIPGLPRGLSVSAVLSEYAMRPFDQVLRSLPGVYYYARYVDDIVVITTGEENKRGFLRKIRASLPSGLQLNHDKTRIIEFILPRVNNPISQIPEDVVDFLGYRFTVYRMLNQNRTVSRRVHADISPNKTSRFKTRMVLSALQFVKDNNFDDFIDRLRVLSGNYNVYDFDRKLRRNVGVYYNYRFVDAAHSSALLELDGFLKRITLSSTGRLGAPLNALLTSKQRRRLLTLSFDRSFKSRSFHHFEINRLTHLAGR